MRGSFIKQKPQAFSLAFWFIAYCTSKMLAPAWELNSVPNEVSVEDKAALEQLQLINELDNEEKSILLKLIETFVSKKRFKDYLQKNIATL